jgi:hypothetical protein
MNENDPTQTPSTSPATSARRWYARWLNGEEDKPQPVAFLGGEQLERPDDVMDPNPDAAAYLLDVGRWEQGGVIFIQRRRGINRRQHITEGARLRCDDPNLHRLPALGWEAD